MRRAIARLFVARGKRCYHADVKMLLVSCMAGLDTNVDPFEFVCDRFDV